MFLFSSSTCFFLVATLFSGVECSYWILLDSCPFFFALFQLFVNKACFQFLIFLQCVSVFGCSPFQEL